MTRSSDLVMVEREVLESIRAAILEAPPDVLTDTLWIPERFSFNETVVDCIDAALQSVEGGFQVAAKQESCPESAPRTETAVRDWQKSAFTYEHDDVAGHLYYFAPQVTAPGPFLEQHHVQAIVDIASDGTFAGVELIDNMPPLAATSTQLTKTPSADHDDGNLRGLAVQGSSADGEQCNEQSCQSLSLTDFDHLCTDRECPIFGQRSCSSNCRCHKTREQMMLGEINRLRKNGVRE